MTLILIKGLESTKQVMHNAIAHHTPTDTQLVPKRQLLPAPHPPAHILGMTSHGREYPFGHFGSAALAVSSPNFLCPSSLLAGWAWEAEKPLTWYKHYLATTENMSVLSTFFSYWTQKITLYQLLERKLTLSQLKPGHCFRWFKRKIASRQFLHSKEPCCIISTLDYTLIWLVTASQASLSFMSHLKPFLNLPR